MINPLLGRQWAAAALLVLAQGTAWAWGHAGHQLIGSLADELLVGSNAGKKVAALLGPGVKDLKSAAVWPDCAREVEFRLPSSFRYNFNSKFHSAACLPFEAAPELGRMEDFARRNWHNCPADDGPNNPPKSPLACHRSYHFTDVAVQRSDYARSHAGTSSHDIVATLQAAIKVLRDGPPAALPFNFKDRKEALLLIAHLVGDLHQPLHVVSVYLKDDGTLADPDAAPPPLDPTQDTRGGNKLEIGDSDLHAQWDDIPAAIKLPNLTSGPGLLRRKALLAAARALPATPGAADTWPKAWASDTVRAAPAAFAGLRFTHKGALKADDWVVQFNDATGYESAEQALQRTQISKAAARLARLLQAVFP